MKKVLKIGCLTVGGFFVGIFLLFIILELAGVLPDVPVEEKSEEDGSIIEPAGERPPKPKSKIDISTWEEKLNEVSPEPSPPPPQKSAFEVAMEKVAHKVHATVLAQDYDNNEFAADKKYKGKLILVRGEISNFSDMFGIASINLKTEVFMKSLTCEMHPDQRPLLAQLKKGDDVLVIGTVKGFSFIIEMEDCLIARVPDK
jgi:hypothetical protein